MIIDLTKDIPAAGSCPYGPGTTTNPLGETITADQRSFFLNGKAWIPIVGEFHYARYREADHSGNPVYFFTELLGVRPEIALDGREPEIVIPGAKAALTVKTLSLKTVTFVVLTAEQGKDFYNISLSGTDHAILSKAAILADGKDMRLQSNSIVNLIQAQSLPSSNARQAPMQKH